MSGQRQLWGRPYVVAFAGSRDGYQVPLALHEAGLLSQLVTDAYVPDPLAGLAPRLPEAVGSRLTRRHVDGLPSGLVRSTPSLVARRLVLHRLRGQYRALRLTDERLGRKAGEYAGRVGHAGLVYSYYWQGFLATNRRRSRPCVVFQVHPVPSHIRRVLAQDRARTGIRGWLDEEEVVSTADTEAFEESLLQADGLVVPSRFVLSGLLELGIPEERVAVVPYGCSVDPVATSRPEEGTTGPLRLLWVGQATYRKGAHHLLRALRSLPEDAATLTMVCRSGDRDVLGDVPPGVDILGPVSARRLRELYSTHDWFVMPSLAEGFGLVYLEAMAHGTPVIATANTGIADLATGSAALVTVPAGDWRALADLLQSLRAEKQDLVERRRAARALAETMSWSRFRSDLRTALQAFADEG